MKHCALLLILTLTTATMLSQDWAPFVAGKIYCFDRQHDAELRVECFVLYSDSYNDQWLYFGTPIAEYCEFFTRIELIEDYWSHLDPDMPLIYNIYEDFVLIYGQFEGYEQWIKFKPNSRPGDQWITNNMTLACIAEAEMEVLGVTDSIKRYEFLTPPFEGVQLILSKNHGFVQFPALGDIFNPNTDSLSSYFQLIGVTDSSGTLGYRQPDFSDYFHLQLGDILVWNSYEKQYHPIFIDLEVFHVDSLIYTYIESDSVYYLFHRRTFDLTGEVIGESSHERHHLRNREGASLHASTSWFTRGYADDEFFLFQTSSLFISDNDSQFPVTQFSYSGPPLLSDGCSVYFTTDIYESYHYDTRHGLNAWYIIVDTGHRWEYIIGSIIDGITYGDIEIPTSVVDVMRRSVRIYPNPAQDILSVEGDLTSCSSIAIFDIYGREVMRVPCFSSLSVARLHSGVYFMQFLSADRDILATTRFIRQ